MSIVRLSFQMKLYFVAWYCWKLGVVVIGWLRNEKKRGSRAFRACLFCTKSRKVVVIGQLVHYCCSQPLLVLKTLSITIMTETLTLHVLHVFALSIFADDLVIPFTVCSCYTQFMHIELLTLVFHCFPFNLTFCSIDDFTLFFSWWFIEELVNQQQRNLASLRELFAVICYNQSHLFLTSCM